VAGGSRIPLQHPRQLGPDRLQLGHLGVDLSHAGAQQRLAVAAGTQALVADGQQLPNLAQAQADPLSALDEPQPRNRVLVVLAVAGGGPLRRWQQALGVVVAHGRGAEAAGFATGGASVLALAPWFVAAGVAIGCVETAEHAAVAALAPAVLRGSAFGLLAAVQSFGNLAASTIAGLLWTLASPRVAFGYLVGWMLLALAGFLTARRSSA
jgi:hypothetical protein